VGSAHSDKRCGDFPPALGDDRYLDEQIWVSRPSSHFWQGHDVTGVCNGRYHNNWEFWAYNAAFGFFQAPYYSYSQTVMAELTPPGFSYMVRVIRNTPPPLQLTWDWSRQFFGLFGMVNRASSIVGPNVIQAIINRTGNTWQGFSFLFAVCLASSLIIWFVVDLHKGRRDAERWAVEKRGSATAIYFGPE
jgi:MFS family permease